MDRRRKVLGMGASGNVGARDTRQLVERGAEVRALLRRSSSTKGIDGLEKVIDLCAPSGGDEAAVD